MADQMAMGTLEHIISLVRSLGHDERGIAVPTAMMALIASFALASVAVMSTVDVQRGTKRDHDSKEAIAAADAGANIALLRLNRYLPSLSTAHPCVGPSGEYQAASAGWCPATVAEPVGGAVYSYRISAFSSSGSLEVVAVGASGTVDRRVNVSLKSLSGKNVFADERLIGQDWITIAGSSAKIETDFGTNGDIVTNGHPKLCGDARHGVGKDGPTPTCDGEELEGNKNLPLVTAPANLVTENDNCRLAQNCTGAKAGKVDTYSKKNSTPWSSGPKAINISGQGTLTMGGNDYLICSLKITAGKIFMPVGSHVRIFVAPPLSCGMDSGATQVEIKGNSNLESTGYIPQQQLFDVPGIYMLGNGAVNLAGNSGSNELMLYAPESAIDIGGEATWNGMIAGKTLTIHGTPFITSDSRIKEPDITLSSLFQRTRYVECIGATASPPTAGC